MPRLSLTMKMGTVAQWFKKEGEAVQKGEPIVEVLSEKVTYDVEAPESGTLRKILVQEGTDVPVDETIGLIAAPNEQISDAEIAAGVVVKEVEEAAVAPAPKEEIMEKAGERVLASPAAKRLAKEHGVDLTQVTGSGPEGRIVEEDVQKLIEETKTHPRVKEIIPLSGIRKTTAERLALSARTAPHATVTMEVDMTNAVKLHEETQASYTEMLVKAVAKALREQPIINATLEDEQIKVYEGVNVGVAVATEKGLIVPVIRDADKKSLNDIASTLKELVEKARQHKLAKEDVTGGTFTITNLGMYSVDVFIPIINPPETAILGVGRMAEKPVVVNGHVAIKPVMQLSLSFDHRIVDGAPAAQFLQKVKQNLESVF
jgi:pyruvate dehydrogenase E2 component (dihydrolipoamide acetyltransferase)